MSLDKSTRYCWFESATRLGKVYTGFEMSEAEQRNLVGPHCVFQQAALVSNSELFVQAIELWQKIDLDLMPCDQPGDSGIQLELALKPAITEANSTGQTSESPDSRPQTSRKILAVFPVESFADLVPLDEELSGVLSINSSAVLLQVKLDDFEISAEEYDSLESGAVVVLPKSYEPHWIIGAESVTPDLPFYTRGKLKQSKDSTEILLSPLNSSESETSTRIDSGVEQIDMEPGHYRVGVYSQIPCEVPINQLLGGSSDIHIPIDTSQLALTSENRVIAHGALLAYGRGVVLAVSQMVAPG